MDFGRVFYKYACLLILILQYVFSYSYVPETVCAEPGRCPEIYADESDCCEYYELEPLQERLLKCPLQKQMLFVTGTMLLYDPHESPGVRLQYAESCPLYGSKYFEYLLFLRTLF